MYRFFAGLLFTFILNTSSYADFTGKCVGISDGDTVSVMKDGRSVKIRLEGIDCPEAHQDFGAKAKQFTSALIFSKNVDVKEKETDRYGRIIGRVFVDGKDLSLELIKAGLAWHYKQYSKEQVLADAEKKAREDMVGLWGMENPISPWEFRLSVKQTSTNKTKQTTEPKNSMEETVYITQNGTKYHRAECKYLKNSIPISKEEAIKRDLKPCSACNP